MTCNVVFSLLFWCPSWVVFRSCLRDPPFVYPVLQVGSSSSLHLLFLSGSFLLRTFTPARLHQCWLTEVVRIVPFNKCFWSWRERGFGQVEKEVMLQEGSGRGYTLFCMTRFVWWQARATQQQQQQHASSEISYTTHPPRDNFPELRSTSQHHHHHHATISQGQVFHLIGDRY